MKWRSKSFQWMDDQAGSIRRKVFEGVVPIRFIIPDVEFPLCFNAPRCQSLGTFAYANLGFFLGQSTRDLWFSCGREALKWHLPLGCIYDALTPDIGVFAPLTIEIHRDHFPDGVLPCDSADAPSSFFRHSFKESLQITHGNQDLITHQTLHQKVEAALDEKNFAALADGLDMKLKSIDEWKKWPIRFVRRNLSVIQSFLAVEEAEQNVQDAMDLKRLSTDAVIIHGVRIDPASALREVMPVLLYPDGFLYAVI
jgi:hypothetical protein